MIWFSQFEVHPVIVLSVCIIYNPSPVPPSYPPPHHLPPSPCPPPPLPPPTHTHFLHWVCDGHRPTIFDPRTAWHTQNAQRWQQFWWHQPCKNQTALQLHHFGGYSKRAIKTTVIHLESHPTRAPWVCSRAENNAIHIKLKRSARMVWH